MPNNKVLSPSLSPPAPEAAGEYNPPLPTQLASHVRKRLPRQPKPFNTMAESSASQDGQPSREQQQTLDSTPTGWTRQNQWIVLAIASGACAALNGVFAKLTTTELTTNLAHGIAQVFGLSFMQGAVEVAVRCLFFGLNLVFNGVMWTLFTKALARGHSTTQVSIMNTSSNFFITAILGLAIFSESLPPLWWLGASMLVAGNVIIGRHDNEETVEVVDDNASSAASLAEDGLASGQGLPQLNSTVPLLIPGLEKDDDEDVAQLGEVEEDLLR